VLGIFQMLLSSKKSSLYAFDVLDSIVKSFQPADITPYFGQILRLVFTKLQENVADSLKLRFARFFHQVAARLEAGYGADYFIEQSNQVDERVFTQVYPSFVLQETEKLARPVDRKVAVVALTKTLCDSQAFGQRFKKGWGNTCRLLLSLLANPPTVGKGVGDEIIAEADVDDIGFGVSFTALNTCKPLARDDYPEIVNVTDWVKHYMMAANERHGGAIQQFINDPERLQPHEQEAIVNYMR
jgi:exportin-2 (importin alpha re-exporter)